MDATLAQMSIVIPSFNGVSALRETLKKLEREAPEAEVIVCDGGSTDGSRELVLEQFSQVKLLDVPNYGYAHNMNRGLEVASRDVLVLMNSDVLISHKTLLAMMTRLLNVPWLGAVGPVPLQSDGRKQFSFGFPYWPNWTRIDRPRSVKMLHGYCLATRRDVLEMVGGLDENFFFYNEEYDWCWRLLKAGWSLEILPETAIHLGGASTPSNPKVHLEGRRGGIYLVDKHFPRWIAEATRRLFQLEGWIMSNIDFRLKFRAVWHAEEKIAKRRAYLESPFPLSGRGEFRFVPRSSSNAAPIPVRPVPTDESRVSSQGELVPIAVSTD